MRGQGRKSRVLVPVPGSMRVQCAMGHSLCWSLCWRRPCQWGPWAREAGDPTQSVPWTPWTRLCPSGSHGLFLLAPPTVPSPFSQGWGQGLLQVGPAKGTDGTTCP